MNHTPDVSQWAVNVGAIVAALFAAWRSNSAARKSGRVEKQTDPTETSGAVHEILAKLDDQREHLIRVEGKLDRHVLDHAAAGMMGKGGQRP